MLMDDVVELFGYWERFPPLHESARTALIGWGLMRPPAEDEGVRAGITDDDVMAVEALRRRWGSA